MSGIQSNDHERFASSGYEFAGVHFVAFIVSIFIANQDEGWVGVYVWPFWMLIDLPWSLLYIVANVPPVQSILSAFRSLNPILDFALYPPYLIHGVIGTVWWFQVPRLFARLRSRWTD